MDPNESEVSSNGIEPPECDMSHTGLIKMTVGDKRYRLRRPFLGEFKALRLAMADVEDETAQARDEALAHAEEARKRLEAAADDHDAQRAVIAWTRERTEEMYARAEEARLGWWGQVFEAVSLDGVPEEWPAWVLDPNLPGQAMAHFRDNPFRAVDRRTHSRP